MPLILLIPRVISLSAALPAISRLLTSTGPWLLRSLIPTKANVRPFSSIPLPPGYTFYRNHNDNNPSPPNMTPRPDQIYVSHIPTPQLPRTSVFEFLFPKSKQYNYFPAPAPNPSGVKKAFIDGLTGNAVTREQVEEQALALAGGLKKLGVKTGEVACLFGMNSLEWINALFGCQALGVVTSPANYAYTPPELLHQVKDSTSQIIFVQPNLVPVLKEALKLDPSCNIPESKIILLCPKDKKPADLKHLRCTGDLWDVGKGIDGRAQWEEDVEKKTAYLCYSSGTTGKAKGVETSHHNMTSQIQAVRCSFEPMTEKDVILGILPCSHIYGLTMNLHHAMSTNGTVVILPKFEEKTVLEVIQQYKVTFSLIVPPMMIALIHSSLVSSYDISSVRGFQSGAAPLSADLIRAFESRFPHIQVTQGYGLTETTPVSHVMTLDESRHHPGAIGRVIPTYQARLVDAESGKDVEIGERGELWLKGPSVMKGYWRNEEATRNVFDDGWFKTGDIAIVDDRKYFTIVDRVKELIKYKGFQVPPAELEALLLGHPNVADVGVIGVYDKSQATELPRAYIVPKGGLASLSLSDREKLSKEVHDWAAKKVANHKKLRGGVILIEAIPKSPSGKILRKDLRLLSIKEQEEGVKATRGAKL
ncbi:AMP-binding protein [Cryptococcus neoformans]|nr:AMP-binding protein [Cryptococcus neoformans var. grubii Th84]OXH00697.1 AMP-binding protein [Cryptococcus neoformans var. grubii]OXH22406.1 AMP-binding protein [Cryptococcus neoformans var. grubii]OXH42591.1 AMP-binding protein [Cryptococcus neoformans var. grubii]OXH43096.1 AMP-binding protein [Cryptococcus neoformans var. grubii]